MNSGPVRRVALVAANRLPFARSNTAYGQLSNKDMLIATLRGLVEKCSLQGDVLGEVVGGAVMKHSRDWNLIRECVLSSGLSARTPAFDVQQACGTGLEAAILVANKIALGQIDAGIACGVDTTSDVPVAVHPRLQRALMDLNGARSAGAKILPLLRALHPGNLMPELPSNKEPRTRLSMGQHAERTARHWGIGREDQDALALASHRNLARAYQEGFFDDLVMPFNGLARDNILRPDSSPESLARLMPAFDRKGGTITAANASALTDGASAVLLATDAWARAHQLPVLAYFAHAETAAVDFLEESRDGLLMAPVYAVPRMLDRAGLQLQDFDFYEIHEAFAAVVLCTLAAWESQRFCHDRLGRAAALGAIDRNKLNVNGSSIAAGHPFAATGGRLLATLAKLLAQKGGGRGLISVCAAGGQGVTAILER